MEDGVITGGWTSLHPLSEGDREAFGELALEFEPLLVATQVVAGVIYCFICNDRTKTPQPYEVWVLRPPSGASEIIKTRCIIDANPFTHR